MSENLRSQIPCDDEIDLMGVIKVIWKRKIFISIGVVICMIAVAMIIYTMPQTYRSYGFYNVNFEEPSPVSSSPVVSSSIVSLPVVSPILPYLTYSEYHRCSILFSNKEDFLKFATKNKLLSDTMIRKLGRKYQTYDAWKSLVKKSVTTVFAISGKNPKRISKNDYVIGFSVSFEGVTPEQAAALTGAFGKYIGYCILMDKLSFWITANLSDATTRLSDLELLKAENEVKFRQLEKSLNEGLKKTKDVKRANEKPSELLFLRSLKLAELESKLVDLVVTSKVLALKVQEIKLKRKFFSNMPLTVWKGESVERLLRELTMYSNKFFQSYEKAIPAEVLKKQLDVSLNVLSNYSSEMKFSVDPIIPKQPIKPKKKMIFTLGFVLSVVIFIFLAFLIEWWENNREKIKI